MRKEYDPIVVIERFPTDTEIFYHGRFDNLNEAVGYCMQLLWEYQEDQGVELIIHPMKFLRYDNNFSIISEIKYGDKISQYNEYIIASVEGKYGEVGGIKNEKQEVRTGNIGADS